MTGLALTILTIVHVAISLAGIASGFIVAGGLLTSRRMDRWTAFFLATTIATSVTGFFFPFNGFTPALGFGIVSLLALAIAVVARYQRKLDGAWRWIFIVAAMIAQYLNVFVLVVQAFLKIPALNALAPTQTEPAFAIAQLVVLVGFVGLTVAAVRSFHIPSHTPRPPSLPVAS